MSQSNDVEQWNFRDSTATSTDDQENFNKRDLDKLFERIPEGAMRESLVFAVNEMMKQGFIIKEFYLAQVRGDLLGAVLSAAVSPAQRRRAAGPALRARFSAQ